MKIYEKYFNYLNQMIKEICQSQSKSIENAAEIIKNVYKNEGIIHLFGAGHSSIPALEVFVRAGCLTFAKALWPTKDLDIFERVEGVGKALAASSDLRKGELIFIFSNSGINPLPIEVAIEAKKMGLKVIAVTSLEQSKKAPARTKSGKKLFEVADLFIDNCCPYGDAALNLEGFDKKIGPVSTISGVAIINAIFVEAAERIKKEGLEIPIRVSRNVPSGDNHNRKFIEKYKERIPDLIY